MAAGEHCSCAFCMLSHCNPCNKAAWISKLNSDKDNEHLEGCRPGRGLSSFTIQDDDLLSVMCFLTWLLKTETHHHLPCLISWDYKRITQGEFPQIKNMIYWSLARENSLPIFTFEFSNSFLSSEHLMLMMNISTETPFSGTNLNWLRNQSFKISKFLSQKLDNQMLLDFSEMFFLFCDHIDK